jgi:tRNA(Ile2) C34 agmatinyltransferase TiaS
MFICVGCGSLELEPTVQCPRCGAIMKSEDELAHDWVGRPGPETGVELRCHQRHRVAYMDSAIARELPYCPFCRKEIESRPRVDEPPPSMKTPPPPENI